MVWAKLDNTRFGEDDVSLPSYSTAIPSSGTAHVKGAYAQLVASTPFDVAGLLITFQFDADHLFMYDIATGGAGSEIVRVPNLLLLSHGATTHTIAMRYIPLRIPAGTRIAMRAQADEASPNLNNVKMQLLADSFAGLEPPERWEDWGTNTSTTSGTVLTGGAANVKGAFSQLIAATSFDTRFVLFELVTGTVDAEACDFAIGTDVKLSDIYTTNEFEGAWSVIPWKIPGGSQIQARVACAGGANTLTVVAYGGG